MLTCESKQEILRKKQRRTPRPIGASSRFIVLLCLFDCLLCVLQCPLGAVPSNTGTVCLDFIRALHSTGDAIRVIFAGRCQEQQVFLALFQLGILCARLVVVLHAHSHRIGICLPAERLFHANRIVNIAARIAAGFRFHLECVGDLRNRAFNYQAGLCNQFVL